MGYEPSPNGANGRGGRDGAGRFAKGNAGGPGNPHARRIGAFREALLTAIKPSDFTAIARRMVEAAKAGEPWAVKELFERTLGRPVELDLLERLEAMEAILLRREGEAPAHARAEDGA